MAFFSLTDKPKTDAKQDRGKKQPIVSDRDSIVQMTGDLQGRQK